MKSYCTSLKIVTKYYLERQNSMIEQAVNQMTQNLSLLFHAAGVVVLLVVVGFILWHEYGMNRLFTDMKE